MKTKLLGKSKISRLNEKLFSSILLDFTPYWNYKLYKDELNQKLTNLTTKEKYHLKCDALDASVVNGSRQPIIYSLVSGKDLPQ